MLRLWQHHHHHLYQQLLPPLPVLCFAGVHYLAPSQQQHRRGKALAYSSEDSTEFVEYKTKGQKKREAIRAVDWAVELSTFSDSQLRRAISWGSLQDEVFDAVKIVKKLGPHGKNARRRQLNLVGGMLRSADPSLMEAIIKAVKDGDVEGVFAKHEEADDGGDDESTSSGEVSDSEDEVDIKGTTERWLEGLLLGDSDVSAEVYAIRSADFDRQELRRLVKDALKAQTKQLITDQNETPDDRVIGPMTSVPKMEDQTLKLQSFLKDLALKVCER